MRARWIGRAAAGVALGFAAVGIVAACDDGPSRSEASTPSPESTAAGASGAQEADEMRTITVSAVGEVELKPDTARVQLGVQLKRPSAAEALEAANQKATALIEALKASGIAEDDLQTSSIWLYPEYDENGREVVAYSAGNQVDVVLRDLETAGETIDTVAGFVGDEVTISGISFYVDDLSAGQSEARIAAMEDAEERAQGYADAAGVGLGEILSISEAATNVPSPIYAEAADRAAGTAVPIETGTLTYSLNVTVVYAMT